MNKTVLITKSGPLFNEPVLDYLLEQGCQAAMVFKKPEEAATYMERLSDKYRERFYPIYEESVDEAGIRDVVEQAASLMGGLQVLIHGVELRCEEEEYALNPLEFGLQTTAALRSRFLYSRAAAAHMARKKAGHILFLLLADSLYFSGFPSSPVLNQGTIAMMKTWAKELSPFRVAVNAVTYGYYAQSEETVDKKKLKQQLDIHTLKPFLPQPQELAAASLAWLLSAPEHLISGQNLHIGAGMDT